MLPSWPFSACTDLTEREGAMTGELKKQDCNFYTIAYKIVPQLEISDHSQMLKITG